MVSRGMRLKISSSACSVSMLRASIGIQGRVVQGGNRQAVIALDIETLAAVRYRPDQYGFPRTIIVACIDLGRLLPNIALQWNQIKDGLGELSNLAVCLMVDVAGYGQVVQVLSRSLD